MVYRIEIVPKIEDTRASVKKKKLEKMSFDGKINNVFIVDVYTIDKKLSSVQLKKIASSLSNPITQYAMIVSRKNRTIEHLPKKFCFAIEIGFLPGVTDNIGNTAKEIIEDLLKIKFNQNEGVFTSQLILISGNLSKEDSILIAESLHNPLIQRTHTLSLTEFRKKKGIGFIVPKVKLNNDIKITEVDLNISDDELVQVGKLGIKNLDGTRRGPLALNLPYLKTIQEYFNKLGRNPTDIELESIAQTWSEHCKHTIFADPIDEITDGLFKTHIKAATEKIRKNKGQHDFCVSVFTDNSGAIEFDDNYLITHKVETHNSPSALDPFGGAITGIVGVNRDALGFGLGSKPITNTYGFCFTDPKDDKPLYKTQDLTQKMLAPKRILDGVVEGVNVGGNCSGIPTPQGFIFFDERYKGKPLVFVGTIGLIPKTVHDKPAFIKKAQPNDYIVMLGGRVGKDGIHGATFSSVALDSGSPRTAVQIGDPITQKKLSDAVVKEARDLELYHSITDNGAGGLSCSVAEMAKESHGCEVELDKVPLKYPGLMPWEIWISESQERMTLAVPKNRWKIFSDLMKRRDVEATIIGKFNNSGKCLVKYKKKIIMDLDMDFLHDGLPSHHLTTSYTPFTSEEPDIKQPDNYNQVFLDLLSRLNISSFEFISTQYDHEVQGTSVVKPLIGKGRINNDATVVKPLLNSNKGIVISQGLAPTYSDIDTYHMAACSIDTAIRNAVVVGVNIDRLALLDNFCWCSSNTPQRLEQLKRATKACYTYAVAYETPFISGKDSMFNDFKGYDQKGNLIQISIPPTLLISSIAVIDDITKIVTSDAKFLGDLIYILGETDDELGGSEYYAMYNQIGKSVPKVNAEKNKRLYKTLFHCINNHLIASSISINRGGLAVALAKTALSGMFGLDISLKELPGSITRDDFALFSETQGRILVTINPIHKHKFETIMHGNPFLNIGNVTNENFITVKGLSGKKIIKVRITKALDAYKKRFRDH